MSPFEIMQAQENLILESLRNQNELKKMEEEAIDKALKDNGIFMGHNWNCNIEDAQDLYQSYSQDHD